MKRCDPNARAKCPDREHCELYAEFADGSECDKFNEWVLSQPMTNADHIRAMSDEKLAEVIMCPWGSEPDICCTKGTCLDCCEKWLQQPAEEGE